MALTIRAANQRLLRLARILENIEEPNTVLPDGLRQFDMANITHRCGSPSCAWGYWLEHAGTPQVYLGMFNAAAAAFKLNIEQAVWLFGSHVTRTRDDEVRIIRQFVAERSR